MVKHFAEPLCPFTLQATPFGEMIQFDIEKTLQTVLGAYGFLSIAVDKSVSVTQSINAVQLQKICLILQEGSRLVITVQDAYSQRN